ncbi:augmin complex subunit dgt3 [Spodoptera litura]|uniref:Augmin complex subunit dgt3 n=1 Tax=Spodoptera litura TaxID=69820 RepID=A0A9J7IG09_SPOLT|nr:augmin complex subunit dgt3 [Spodoptera litura]
MNALNEMSDEEFVPFLHSLGVDTYKKSFEWMLNDRDFAGVLRWLHNNLDHNNALSAREECRYIELEKKGLLLSAEDLESSISAIQEQYEGICLPGDKDRKEDVELDIKMLQERLHMLQKQESILNDLKRQNGLTKEELTLEVSKLNSSYHQWKDDESAAAEECLSLAQEVESITSGVIDVIADTLDVYSSCHCDKENARKFFTFGPFETYRQSQALFRSHFDLYTNKKFVKKANEISSDEELRSALAEAKSMEDRLTDAMCSYIESKAELSGEQAKVALVANYKDVHPSQITSCLMEAQSAVELLEQEESILYQQLHNAVKQFVQSRTALAVETTACCALAVRQQIHADLTHLLDTTRCAARLDRVVYSALRRELRAVEDTLHLAATLMHHVGADSSAVASRINSMNEICSEQESCELRLQSSDILLQALLHIVGAQSGDAGVLVKLYNEMLQQVKELKDNVEDGYRKKEKAAVAVNESTACLHAAVWSGRTRQPGGAARGLSTLAHALRHDMELVDRRVLDASNMFTSVKNGDKQNLRKLWQWFLTDPARLLHALKNANTKI